MRYAAVQATVEPCAMTYLGGFLHASFLKVLKGY